MIVRSHLPWPLRWIVVALVLGFSAAIGMWAFEFGKDIAGLDRNAKAELAALRTEVEKLRSEREGAQSIANTAESLLRTEKVAQEKLIQQLKSVESENLSLKADLGFFQRLLPSSGAEGLSVRALQGQAQSSTQTHYQALFMQIGKSQPEFNGRYEVSLAGTLDGKPWILVPPGGGKPLQIKQSLRVEGLIDHPEAAVVKTLQIKVIDKQGTVRLTQTAKL